MRERVNRFYDQEDMISAYADIYARNLARDVEPVFLAEEATTEMAARDATQERTKGGGLIVQGVALATSDETQGAAPPADPEATGATPEVDGATGANPGVDDETGVTPEVGEATGIRPEVGRVPALPSGEEARPTDGVTEDGEGA